MGKSSRPTGSRATWRTRLLLLACSSALCAVAVEGWLRIGERQRHPRKTTLTTLNGRPYHLLHTSTSFSGKPRRVAIVGDSFVAGTRCGNSHNLPGHYARLAGAGVQVDNLGVSAAQPYDYVDIVTNYVAEVGSPAAIHALYYSNDNAMSRSLCRHRRAMVSSGFFSDGELASIAGFCSDANVGAARESARGRGGGLNTWLYRFRTYTLARELVARLVAVSGADRSYGRARFYGWWEDTGSLQTRLAIFSMRLLRDLARKHGARLTIGFYPNVEHLSRASRLRAAYAGVARLVKRDLDLVIYNGYDVMLSSPEHSEDMSLSFIDTHPTCEAHEIMARHLLRLDAAGRPAPR